MRKVFAATILALIFTLSLSMVAFGNSYSLEAENGKLLSPAELGLDVSTSFEHGQEFSWDSLPVTAKLSYGIRPTVTISGEINRLTETDRQMLVKAYYSPSASAMGYTAYVGYDLAATGIPLYGVSLWLNSDLFYAFIDLEANKESGDTAFLITPGLNLRLSSRIRLAGEIAYEPDAGHQELRIGASYALVDKLSVKLGLQTGPQESSDRVITAGLTLEI